MGAIDSIDRVIDRGVHDGEATRRVNGRGLRPRRTDNHEKCFVPLDNEVRHVSRCACCFLAALCG